MAVKFLSQDWYEQMVEGLKKEFTEVGGVNLQFVQVVEETPSGEDTWMLLELKDSIFVNYEMGTGEWPEAPFAAFAEYGTFKRVIEGELDGKEGLLTGEFTLEGNMAKAMALLGTYNRLEEVQRSIQTNF